MSAGELLHHIRAEVDAADARIRPYVRETPLDYSPGLSRSWGAEVWLKLENTQVTGSFKVRGAVNRILTTPVSQRALGVVTASTGNHGAAVAYAMQRLRIPGTVFVPEGAVPSKLAAIRAWGATVHVHGQDGLETELEARRHAASRGLVYISPYNDPQVVAGQGTVGAELARQVDRIDAIFVSVGGGGLIGGIAGYLKAVGRGPIVVGCSPERSKVMHESVRAGRVLELPSDPTLSDGTAGGVEQDAITFPLCRALVDRWALVNEEDIASAMRLAMDQEHQLIEGAAGVALAAARHLASEFPGGNLVVVLCGANAGLKTLREVLCAES
ncbi:MAG TPA: threonine/serine dehydratase [Gemmatimonadales bacterium]